jgi:hypothetical protein
MLAFRGCFAAQSGRRFFRNWPRGGDDEWPAAANRLPVADSSPSNEGAKQEPTGFEVGGAASYSS